MKVKDSVIDVVLVLVILFGILWILDVYHVKRELVQLEYRVNTMSARQVAVSPTPSATPSATEAVTPVNRFRRAPTSVISPSLHP